MVGMRKCWSVGSDGTKTEVPCGAGGGGGGMTMGERKCFAIGQDGAKTEVPCGGGKGKGKPAAKAKLINAILHRLQMAAARVHSLPTVRSLSLSLNSLSLSLDSLHRNRRYPTHVPCCLMAGMQWPVCPYEYHHEMAYLSLLHSTPSHSVSLCSTPFSPSLSPSLSRLCK
jgi:hypothetical protein